MRPSVSRAVIHRVQRVRASVDGVRLRFAEGVVGPRVRDGPNARSSDETARSVAGHRKGAGRGEQTIGVVPVAPLLPRRGFAGDPEVRVESADHATRHRAAGPGHRFEQRSIIRVRELRPARTRDGIDLPGGRVIRVRQHTCTECDALEPSLDSVVVRDHSGKSVWSGARQLSIQIVRMTDMTGAARIDGRRGVVVFQIDR